MTLPKSLSDREYRKFIEDENGEVAVNVKLKDATISGNVEVDVAAFEDSTGTDKNALVDGDNKIVLSPDSKTQIVDGSGNVIGATSNALDVNIKSGATLEVNLDLADDEVMIGGTSDGGTTRHLIKTDAAGELQVDVLTLPAITGTVTSTQSTASDLKMEAHVRDGAGNTIGSTSNALDINIKSSGVTIGGNAEQTPDAVAATKIVQQGGIAETTVPTAVANGDAVATWVNEFGQQVLYGANLSANAMDTNVVNQALLNTQEVVHLNAVTATGASALVDISNYNKINFHITSSGVTTGGTMLIQSSLDGTNFVTIHTETITTNTTVGISFEGKWKFIRANLSARTDGTYTVRHIAGN
jgi:hypothetical protein